MEENQPMESEYTTVVPESGHSNLLMYSLDTNEIINELKHQLKNEIWNPEKGEFVKLGKSLLNDDGVSVIISIVRPMIDKNTTLSTFDENEIRLKMMEFNFNLIKLLAKNKIDWEISDFVVAGNIRCLINNVVHASLKRGKKALTLNAIRAMERRVESVTERPQKKGLLDDFKKLV